MKFEKIVIPQRTSKVVIFTTHSLLVNGTKSARVENPGSHIAERRKYYYYYYAFSFALLFYQASVTGN